MCNHAQDAWFCAEEEDVVVRVVSGALHDLRVASSFERGSGLAIAKLDVGLESFGSKIFLKQLLVIR